jgi:hypothetical protein
MSNDQGATNETEQDNRGDKELNCRAENTMRLHMAYRLSCGAGAGMALGPLDG